MSKRANGEGSIYRRNDGRWAASLSHTDASGETRRHTVYGRTQAEARTKLKAARERLSAGAPVKDARIRLGQYAASWAATTLAASSRKASTRETYSTLSRTWIEGGILAEVTLDRLKATDVERLILHMREAGKADATIRQTYTVLRAVLDAAVRDGLVAVNVAALVKRPSVAKKDAAYLSPEEVRALLEAGDKGRYGMLLRVLAGTGLRRGEALALRWEDVDLTNGALRVSGTLSRVGGTLTVTDPKTARSRRSVPLTPATVERLKAHKARQAEERLAAGAAWHDLGLVFSTEAGGYVDPRNALRSLTRAATEAGLPGIGLHTLRHSAASAMLGAGVPLVTVSEILGHSSVAITGDVYGHVSTAGAREAMDRLAALLG